MGTNPAVAKPIWWLAVLGVLGLGGAVVSTLVFLEFTGVFDELPLFGGLAGGMFFGAALLGHFPGRYEELAGRGRFVLWVPLSPIPRLGVAVLSIVFGVGLFLLALA